MNTDFKSLERRYGTALAQNIADEISRAERRQFSFYKIPHGLKSVYYSLLEEERLLPEPLKRLA